MARRQNRVDLITPRPLRVVEDLDGFSCVLLDKTRTEALGRQIFLFHLGMMAAFLTVVGAPFAWLAALLNILLSPKVAFWRLSCSQHAVRLTPLSARTEPGVPQATTDVGTTGPSIWGLGTPPPSVTLPFSEITALGATDHDLWFTLRSGEHHHLPLELTSPEDIQRLEQRIRQSWERFIAGVTLSAEDAEQHRQQLGALLQRSSPQRSP